MLTTYLVAIALAAGIALPHAHALPAFAAHVHVTSADTSGGGPPTHP